MQNENGLIILAKAPEKGNVKTRLKKHLQDDERLRLYTYLLEKTISKLKDLSSIDSFICYSPKNAAPYFRRFGPGIFPQVRGGIGIRMFSAIERLFMMGYQRVALVGVDIPELSADIVLKGFDLLQDHDVVFGPAHDGGYSLVGMNRPAREIFEQIQWSTDTTLKESVRRTASLGLSIGYTDLLRDIDRVEDLDHFRGFIP